MEIKNKSKILVIEDIPVRRELFKKLLKNMDVDFASSVFSAIVAIKSKPFDIIFLDHDLGIPEPLDPKSPETGYEVCKYFIEYKLQKQALIIIHSCNPVGAISMLNLLNESGYKAFLKPFTMIMHETKIRVE